MRIRLFVDQQEELPRLVFTDSWQQFKHFMSQSSLLQDNHTSSPSSSLSTANTTLSLEMLGMQKQDISTTLRPTRDDEEQSLQGLPLTHIKIHGVDGTASNKKKHVARMVKLLNRYGQSTMTHLVLHGVGHSAVVAALRVLQQQQTNNKSSLTHLSIVWCEVRDKNNNKGGSRSMRRRKNHSCDSLNKNDSLFLNFLQINRTIQHLDFGGTRLPPSILQQILRGAEHHPSLTSLVFDNNCFDVDCLRHMERLLLLDKNNNNNNITSLSVSRCFMRCPKEFAESMVRVLRHNTTLLKLNVSGNRIDSEGWESLLSGVLAKENHTLRELQLSDTAKASHTAKSIATMLRANRGLQKLRAVLSSPEEDVLEMLDVLSHDNTTLKDLDLLLAFKLDASVARGLANMLVANRTLESVQIKFGCSSSSQATKRLLLEGLRQNHSITRFSVECFTWFRVDDSYEVAVRYYTDRNRMNRFLAMSKQRTTPRLWMHGLEKASAASLDALYYYVRETNDVFRQQHVAACETTRREHKEEESSAAAAAAAAASVSSSGASISSFVK